MTSPRSGRRTYPKTRSAFADLPEKDDGVFHFTKRCDTSVRYGMIVYTSETRATNEKADVKHTKSRCRWAGKGKKMTDKINDNIVVGRKNDSSEEEKTMNRLKLSDLEMVSGGVLDNDYIDYLTRVIFYAKRADKTLEQVLSDLRDRNCTQEALDYVAAHW